jgi:hypothetical protein
VVGIVVFRLLHFWAESVIIRNVPREEWPKIQVAVRHAQMQKLMGALRTWELKQLPILSTDCLVHPVVGIYGSRIIFSSDEIIAVTGKKEIGYLLKKNGPNWNVVSETTL